MVCPSEAEARWPRFGLVVVATTSRRYNKDQMIRPLAWPCSIQRTIVMREQLLQSVKMQQFFADIKIRKDNIVVGSGAIQHGDESISPYHRLFLHPDLSLLSSCELVNRAKRHDSHLYKDAYHIMLRDLLTQKCVHKKKVTYFGYPRACRFRKHQIENRSPDLPLPTFFKT
jgi:hypothetical protein